VVIVNNTPVDGILSEAKRFLADIIVVGWRGHGAVRRLLMGSVSRGVVRGAACSVLVVRRSPRRVKRIVIGFDTSPGAFRAVTLVGRLVAPQDGRVTLISAVELKGPSSLGPVAGGIRASVADEVKRINTARTTKITKALNRAAAKLKRNGWETRSVLRSGEPLRELLAAVARAHPQLLAVGTRGSSGVRHLLLGSVAEGALNRLPVPVLVAR
jgi:nucleotide-binding universal stress UspA family protein